MKLKKKKIEKLGLPACVIFLILNFFSCTTTPYTTWDWKPSPYVADHEYQSIISVEGEVIKEVYSKDPKFNDFTCFTSDDISSLKFNIERLRLGGSN